MSAYGDCPAQLACGAATADSSNAGSRSPVDPPKRRFWVGPARRTDTAEGWQGGAVEQAGSWWLDWMEWLKPQCGGLVDAPPVATEAFPALADAPGTYVLER